MKASNIPMDIVEKRSKFRPHYVFIQLGASDISVDRDYKNIVDDLRSLVTSLLTQEGVEDVFLSEIPCISDFTKSPGLKLKNYDRQKKSINRKLYRIYGGNVIRFRKVYSSQDISEMI